jgi:hypothetical protein
MFLRKASRRFNTHLIKLLIIVETAIPQFFEVFLSLHGHQSAR